MHLPIEFDAQFDARFAFGQVFELTQAHNAGPNSANLSRSIRSTRILGAESESAVFAFREKS
jgi:hypothetical protein